MEKSVRSGHIHRISASLRLYLYLLSRVFDPFVVLFLVIIGAIRKSSLTDSSQVYFLLLETAFFVLAALFLLLAIKKRMVSGWDMKDRIQRPKVLIVLLLLQLFNLFLVKFIGDQFLFTLFILFFIWLTGFFLVTLFWKISGHAGCISLAVGLCITWFGWQYWPIVLTIPLVGWIRVKGKYHTPAQVIVGTMYSFVCVMIYSYFL